MVKFRAAGFMVVFALMAVLFVACGKKGQAGSEASLQDLNRAMMNWSLTSGGKPLRTVYDLTNSPSLRGKRLPTPPAGKKLLLDAKARRIVFANQ